jgi:hypothetical protein
MDTTLVGVTLISLAMAGGLSLIVWRMLRDERARSEARVAALATMVAAPAAAKPDLPLRQAPASVGEMFIEPEHASPWGNRVAVMAALGLVIASAVLFALAATGTKTSARAAGASRAPVNAAAPVAGLELLSLRDSRQADTLTITGLVHNPQSGTPLSRVTVTAYTFDDNGSFLASGRALIDVTTFAPGDDSPFVVTVPVTGTIARYRIGFRAEDGRVISHIDKRQQASLP